MTISYRNGYAAYMSGASTLDNPNISSPQEYQEWYRGWIAAKTSRQ
jgi:hypothetical protein